MPTITDVIGSDGAIVRVEVGVSHTFRRNLQAAGRPVPQPVTLTAILDTGAEMTCIDPRVSRRLQLVSAPDFGAINVPSVGGLTFQTVTNVRLTILHPSGNPPDHLTVHDLPVAELPLGVFRIDVLIGRDVLALCRFDYDGPAGLFALAY